MGFAVKWNLTPLTDKQRRAPPTQCGFQCRALLCKAQNPNLQQVSGAEDGIWTHTTLRSLVPETSAYAVSPPLHIFLCGFLIPRDLQSTCWLRWWTPTTGATHTTLRSLVRKSARMPFRHLCKHNIISLSHFFVKNIYKAKNYTFIFWTVVI